MSAKRATLVEQGLTALHVNWDVVAVLVLFFASFSLYASTSAPGVLDGDFGEFQTNMHVLGVSHTGYPLYFLLGKLWTLVMPVGSVAFRANVFSGLFGAFTLTLIYGLMRTLSKDRPVALFVAILFGVSRVEWSQSVVPDVYTLNSFFIVLVLWLAILWRTGRVPLWCVALAYGLSLTHHRTMILIAPALGLFVLWGAGRRGFEPRELLKTLVALFLPLLLYAYIPLRGASDVGVEYHPGSTVNIFALNAFYDLRFGPPGFLWERFTRVYLALLIEQFTLIGFVLGLVGVGALAFQRVPLGFPRNMPPRQLLLLLGLAHIGETAFAICFWVFDSEIFFIPSFLTYLFFIGIGIAILVEAVASRIAFQVPRRTALALITLGLVALCGYLVWTNLPRVDQSQNDQADARWQEILAQPLEENATIAGPWQDLTPLEYYQYVEKVRPDLKRRKVVVHRDQLPFAPQGDIAAEVRETLGKGASVYLTLHPDDAETLDGFHDVELVPVASLWRADLPGAESLALKSAAAGDGLHTFGLLPERTSAGEFNTLRMEWSTEMPLEETRMRLTVSDPFGHVWLDQELFPFGNRPIQRETGSVLDVQGFFMPSDAPPGDYQLELAAFERDSQTPVPIAGESNTVRYNFRLNASNRAVAPERLAIAHDLPATLGAKSFWGYALNSDWKTPIAEPRGGDIVELQSWWQGITDGKDSLEIKLRDANDIETVLYQGELIPAPQSDLRGDFNPAQIVRARHTITMPPTAAAGYARVVLGLNGEQLPPIRIALGESTRRFRVPIIQRPQLTLVGDSMQLLGYKLDRTQFRAGETVPLTLYWSASHTPQASYKVFVHLLDEDGNLRAQQDSMPRRGGLPTDRWFPGEYVTDEYALALPGDLAPGDYRIVVGMYGETSGERVTLTDANGNRIENDAVELGDRVGVQ